MKPIDYILIAVAVVGVVGIILHLIRRKKQGKGGCGCGCVGCKNAVCPSSQKAKEENEND